MIAFYGMGGGFGHLTRIKTFIRTLGITEPCKVITANNSVFRLFKSEEVLFIEADNTTTKEELAEKIRFRTDHFHFDQLFIDTFPCGILGELGPQLIHCKQRNYLARRLIWKKYKNQITQTPEFDQAYRFEPLETEHQQFIDFHCKRVVDVSLDYLSGQSQKPPPLMDSKEPVWLIIHTSHEDELRVLIDHAEDIATIEGITPKLVILSDVKVPLPPSAILIHDQNPLDWYPYAHRIFSAAGFNTWHQLAPWRDKHIVIPFKRRFDDQFWRVVSSG